MRPDLAGMLPHELKEYLVTIGQPAYRAKQILTHIVRGQNIDQMTTLPMALREALSCECDCRLPRVVEKQVSKTDGTTKYLMTLTDGECVESVLMHYHHGYSLCISSQVGCRMGCRFCASTLGGRVRNLFASEMLGQVIAAQNDCGERISHVVMMGIGEPLDNYDEAVRFLRLASCPDILGISLRHISLSTCGVVPGIRRLMEEGLPITLSISLHAATDEARDKIMPVNHTYPLQQLLSACADWFIKTGRRISFEYTLLGGKNDTSSDAAALAKLLHRYLDPVKAPIHVNLIRVNEVAETGFVQGSYQHAMDFAAALGKYGVNATLRRRLGDDVDAACGQLRRKRQENKSNMNI